MTGDQFDLEARQLNITQLVTLSLVAKYQSYTLAAESMGVSQPSVSLQVRELEKACSCPLVFAQGRRLKLTPLGEDLAQIGAHIALDSERAVRKILSHRAGEAGNVIVGASMTAGAYVLPGALARYESTHPHVRVDVRIANTLDVAEMDFRRYRGRWRRGGTANEGRARRHALCDRSIDYIALHRRGVH
jgi:DNA-binding transcriptional LysR family regulator